MKKAIMALGVLGISALALAILKGGNEDDKSFDGSDDLDDDTDEEYYEPKKKTYRGHIPSGCAACGGPYPDCKSSCPMFDD